ncbi:MAG: RNA 2',3'-cyclic phosphodiesterase [Candidatus Pacearchaeota archaeon]|jgi:2'-5' RNA ligase
MVRLFIAVDLPENLKKEIIDIQKKIDKEKLFVGKFTEVENLHLTLKFLGDISEDKVEEVQKRLERVKFNKFEVKIDRVGVFDSSFIRIIWIGLAEDALFELQKRVDDSLEGLFSKEERFMAHITIARPKFVSSINRQKLIEFLNKIEIRSEKFTIDRISLKKSELKSSGPFYEDLLVVEGK